MSTSLKFYMRIRNIKFEDLYEVYELLNQLKFVETSQVDKELAWKEYNSEGLVVEHEGKILGYGALVLESKIRGYKSAQIEDVVIDEKYRGKGWGKLLLEELCNRAEELGVYRISLFCNEELVSFYNKSGFEINNVVMKKFLKS